MAEWTAAYINDLPDSAFACPDKRTYPHHTAEGKLDLPHLRAALSRVGDPSNEQCGRTHLMAHRKEAGMGESKALIPVKAAPLDPDQEEAFWQGKVPWRLLAIPFGGPIMREGAPRGVDLDGDWFSENTDIYGGVAALKATRERLVDWHHSYAPARPGSGDPTGRMSGVIIAKAILEDEPDEDGWWVKLWAKAGESRLRLIRRLREQSVQLFGSSQAIPGTVKGNRETGEITSWGFLLETLTTSPQNTLSVLRPMKAALDAIDPADLSSDMQELLVGLDALGTDLAAPSGMGVQAAKAGRVLSARNEGALREALDRLSTVLAQLEREPAESTEDAASTH